MILRDRDANTAWEAASDGVLEERIYYCQNWRHDVVALITEAGHQVQQIRYSAYGIPFGIPAGDVNSDGSVTSLDSSILADWVANSIYDVRGDINLDGVVDNNDRTLVNALVGNSLGWGTLSLDVDAPGGGGGNRKGYAGYEGDFSRDGFWHVRHRVLDSELGRWTRRDPLEFMDGMNTYQYVASEPIRHVDPSGLLIDWQFNAWSFSFDPPEAPCDPSEASLDSGFMVFLLGVKIEGDVTVKLRKKSNGSSQGSCILECGEKSSQTGWDYTLLPPSISLNITYGNECEQWIFGTTGSAQFGSGGS